MPIEAWRSAVSTTLEGCRVSSEVRLENSTQVWWWAKFGQRATHSWGKIVLHTCSDFSEPIWTGPRYSDHVRSSCSNFLHLRKLLFFGIMSYPGEIAYFNLPYSSVLRPIQLKLHILTRLIESFPTVYGLWSCIEVKLSITPGAHA